MYPDKRELRAYYAEALRIPLAYTRIIADRMFRLFEHPPKFKRDDYDPRMIHAAASLVVRACRFLHQCAELSEFGQADGVSVLGRSLFDGFLAEGFICRDEVIVKGTHGDYADLYAAPLSQEFRAALYVAFGAIKREQALRNIDEQLGRKPEVAEDDIKYKEAIGEKWCEVLKSANTCAGVSIVNLADSLNALSWQKTVYKLQSGTAHANDPDRYVKFLDGTIEKATLYPTDDIEDTRDSLKAANIAFTFTVSEFFNLIDREHQPYRDLNVFTDGIKELVAVFENNSLPPWYDNN